MAAVNPLCVQNLQGSADSPESCRGRCRSQPFATKERYGCGSAACRYTSAHWATADLSQIPIKTEAVFMVGSRELRGEIEIPPGSFSFGEAKENAIPQSLISNRCLSAAIRPLDIRTRSRNGMRERVFCLLVCGIILRAGIRCRADGRALRLPRFRGNVPRED